MISSLFDVCMHTQGAAIDRILGEIVHNKGMKAPIDYVLCIGHFLPKVLFRYLIHQADIFHLANDLICE